MSTLQTFSSAALIAALTTAAATAQAQPGSPEDGAFASAKGLFREGRDLIAADHWEAGCAKIETAIELWPSAGALLTIADCYERGGRVASAWNALEKARSAAEAQRGLRGDEVTDLTLVRIDEQVARLTPRLPHLTLELATPSEAPPGMTLSRGDVPLAVSTLGTPIPVDPGETVVTLRAPGFEATESRVTIDEGETATLRLVLHPLPEPDPEPAAMPTAPPAPVEAPTPTWAWVAGGVGVALAGAAVGFSVDAQLAVDGLKDACTAPDADHRVRCDGMDAADVDAANARKNRGRALGIGLGVGAAVALTASIVSLSLGDEGADDVSLSMGAGPGGGRADLTLRF